MTDDKKEFYLVHVDALSETLYKTAKIKELLEHSPKLTVNQACDRIGLSRSAFYQYRDRIFAYHKIAREKIITLVITMQSEASSLAACLNILQSSGGEVLTVNMGMPVAGSAKAILIVDTTKMHQEMEFVLEKIYEIPSISQAEMLD